MSKRHEETSHVAAESTSTSPQVCACRHEDHPKSHPTHHRQNVGPLAQAETSINTTSTSQPPHQQVCACRHEDHPKSHQTNHRQNVSPLAQAETSQPPYQQVHECPKDDRYVSKKIPLRQIPQITRIVKECSTSTSTLHRPEANQRPEAYQRSEVHTPICSCHEESPRFQAETSINTTNTSQRPHQQVCECPEDDRYVSKNVGAESHPCSSIKTFKDCSTSISNIPIVKPCVESSEYSEITRHSCSPAQTGSNTVAYRVVREYHETAETSTDDCQKAKEDSDFQSQDSRKTRIVRECSTCSDEGKTVETRGRLSPESRQSNDSSKARIVKECRDESSYGTSSNEQGSSGSRCRDSMKESQKCQVKDCTTSTSNFSDSQFSSQLRERDHITPQNQRNCTSESLRRRIINQTDTPPSSKYQDSCATTSSGQGRCIDTPCSPDKCQGTSSPQSQQNEDLRKECYDMNKSPTGSCLSTDDHASIHQSLATHFQNCFPNLDLNRCKEVAIRGLFEKSQVVVDEGKKQGHSNCSPQPTVGMCPSGPQELNENAPSCHSLQNAKQVHDQEHHDSVNNSRVPSVCEEGDDLLKICSVQRSCSDSCLSAYEPLPIPHRALVRTYPQRQKGTCCSDQHCLHYHGDAGVFCSRRNFMFLPAEINIYEDLSWATKTVNAFVLFILVILIVNMIYSRSKSSTDDFIGRYA